LGSDQYVDRSYHIEPIQHVGLEPSFTCHTLGLGDIDTRCDGALCATIVHEACFRRSGMAQNQRHHSFNLGLRSLLARLLDAAAVVI
jgi:hypothetical protein